MRLFLQNLALLLARLTLGLGFLFAGLTQVRHGGAGNAFGLRIHPDWLPANVFDAYGGTLPWLELAVGGLLVLGLFTRAAAGLLFLLITLHCATVFDATPATGNAFLQAATLAAFGLVIVLTGGGKWALEERLGGGGKSAPAPADK